MGDALQLKGEEEHLDVLAPLVSAHGEGWVCATLRPETTGTGKTEREVVGLRIDGRPVGRLTPAMSAHCLPTIAHLQAGGFSTAARLLVKGNQLKVEAVLHAAKARELDAGWLNAVPAAQAPPEWPRPPDEWEFWVGR